MTNLKIAAIATAAVLATNASQATDIKFTLDWKFQGPTAAFIAADALGYYQEEGLNVAIDSGNGSAGAVTRVASGAYQMGFADINALVEFNTQNPDQSIKSVMMVYDAPPFGLYALKSSGIEKPADLTGKILGAPVFDASYKLFPAFAHEVGIDADAVPRVNMDPPLREAMLVRGEVDVISGHYFSSKLDLLSKGVPEDEIMVMMYKDFGMDFYGNAVIASGAFMAEQPDAVAAFNRATAKAIRWIIQNPQDAVNYVAKIDPLIDQALEIKRLGMAIDTNITTDFTIANGFGAIDAERLQRSIAQLALALDLPTEPRVEDIWTDAFLPAAELRALPQ